MASKTIPLPPNWQISAISWAAKKAGMSYGNYKESVLRQDPTMVARIEEEYKANFIALRKAEAERIAAAKRNASARKRRAIAKEAAAAATGA